MADEKQKHAKRFSVDVEVLVGRLRMPVLLSARMVDVGMDGCGVRFAAAVDFEVRSTVELMLKTGRATISSLGTVERADEAGLEFDVSFKEMGERGTRDLQEWLAGLELAAAKMEPVAVETEPVAVETEPVVRKKTEKPARGVSMRPVEPMRMRKHDRHPHQTAVWINPARSLMQFQGTTEDFSKGGCQIRFPRPMELSVGTEMEVWLKAASGMFRVTGWVRRRTEDECGIGVEFDRSNIRSGREVDRLNAGCVQIRVEAGRGIPPSRVEDRIALR